MLIGSFKTLHSIKHSFIHDGYEEKRERKEEWEEGRQSYTKAFSNRIKR
jgi:hypothetical protein